MLEPWILARGDQAHHISPKWRHPMGIAGIQTIGKIDELTLQCLGLDGYYLDSAGLHTICPADGLTAAIALARCVTSPVPLRHCHDAAMSADYGG